MADAVDREMVSQTMRQIQMNKNKLIGNIQSLITKFENENYVKVSKLELDSENGNIDLEATII